MLKRKLLFIFCLTLLSSLSLFSQDEECMNRPPLNQQTMTILNDAEIQTILDYVCCEQVQIHVDMDGPAHGYHFLQWHREYLRGLEDYLISQGLDNLVPLPAWNPCSEIPQPDGLESMDLFSTCPNECPGLFIAPMPDDLDAQSYPCGDFSSDIYTCENMCNFEDFNDFRSTLSLDHNGIHGVFGLTTFDELTSPAVVLFWFWHAYVDDLYLKYQAATLDPDLSYDIEVVEQNCCDVVFKAPKYCCSDISWGFNAPEGGFDDTWSDDQYWYMSASIDINQPTYSATITYTGSCGETRTEQVEFDTPPNIVLNLPDFPPSNLARICLEDFGNSCFDFGYIECLETLEVTTSSSKLKAEVNGTELCLTYIHHLPFVGTITVTPIGACAAGEPVIWTINANQPEDCAGDDDWFPRLSGDQSVFKVTPNPFENHLTVSYEGPDRNKKYSIAILDMLGREINVSSQTNYTFNTESLIPGVYFVKIVNEENEIIFLEKYFKQAKN